MIRDDEIFGEALDLTGAERATFLDRACAGDAALRARVEALLAGHDAAGAFLGQAAVERPQPTLPEEKPGDVIGRYTLLKKIGEGGCGVVYLAEQTEPVRRRVALKVIKLGMDTRQVIARFEAERQALALMDHPDIARVFDAGATAAGRPFFVMEYVDGVPITQFCDEHSLPMTTRLELFARVCVALQHAHQKGIIHRDVKPSNILVGQQDGQPAPKIIDFGIAKATQGRLTEATLITGFDQLIGTPAYMSPEQAELRELEIDTRSDIYSLGVLLYELLTGRPPFDPKSLIRAGVAEIRRIIREVEPARPSTVVSTLADADRTVIAHQRCAAPARLTSALRGDLDWIVMRCLEKDRGRRYDTAHELADDIRRHLRSEPVTACPPSALYRSQKFVARHRVAWRSAPPTPNTTPSAGRSKPRPCSRSCLAISGRSERRPENSASSTTSAKKPSPTSPPSNRATSPTPC
jgi:serine/threonine protein kinase